MARWQWHSGRKLTSSSLGRGFKSCLCRSFLDVENYEVMLTKQVDQKALTLKMDVAQW